MAPWGVLGAIMMFVAGNRMKPKPPVEPPQAITHAAGGR
jgi:hypothetical protein